MASVSQTCYLPDLSSDDYHWDDRDVYCWVNIGSKNMNTQKPDAVELLPCPFCGSEGLKTFCCGDAVPDCPKCSPLFGCNYCDIWLDTAEEWNTREHAKRDEYKRIAEELIDHYGYGKWECSYCEFHHTHRDCDGRLFIGGDGHGPRFASDRQQEIYSIENPE